MPKKLIGNFTKFVTNGSNGNNFTIFLLFIEILFLFNVLLIPKNFAEAGVIKRRETPNDAVLLFESRNAERLVSVAAAGAQTTKLLPQPSTAMTGSDGTGGDGSFDKTVRLSMAGGHARNNKVEEDDSNEKRKLDNISGSASSPMVDEEKIVKLQEDSEDWEMKTKKRKNSQEIMEDFKQNQDQKIEPRPDIHISDRLDLSDLTEKQSEDPTTTTTTTELPKVTSEAVLQELDKAVGGEIHDRFLSSVTTDEGRSMSGRTDSEKTAMRLEPIIVTLDDTSTTPRTTTISATHLILSVPTATTNVNVTDEMTASGLKPKPSNVQILKLNENTIEEEATTQAGVDSELTPRNVGEKRGKFINDNSTNAQQLNLPDSAEVWSLAGMKTVPATNVTTATNNAEEVTTSSAVIRTVTEATTMSNNTMVGNSNSEKSLLDWTRIMLNQEVTNPHPESTTIPQNNLNEIMDTITTTYKSTPEQLNSKTDADFDSFNTTAMPLATTSMNSTENSIVVFSNDAAKTTLMPVSNTNLTILPTTIKTDNNDKKIVEEIKTTTTTTTTTITPPTTNTNTKRIFVESEPQINSSLVAQSGEIIKYENERWETLTTTVIPAKLSQTAVTEASSAIESVMAETLTTTVATPVLVNHHSTTPTIETIPTQHPTEHSSSTPAQNSHEKIILNTSIDNDNDNHNISNNDNTNNNNNNEDDVEITTIAAATTTLSATTAIGNDNSDNNNNNGNIATQVFLLSGATNSSNTSEKPQPLEVSTIETRDSSTTTENGSSHHSGVFEREKEHEIRIQIKNENENRKTVASVTNNNNNNNNNPYNIPITTITTTDTNNLTNLIINENKTEIGQQIGNEIDLDLKHIKNDENSIKLITTTATPHQTTTSDLLIKTTITPTTTTTTTTNQTPTSTAATEATTLKSADEEGHTVERVNNTSEGSVVSQVLNGGGQISLATTTTTTTTTQSPVVIANPLDSTKGGEEIKEIIGEKTIGSENKNISDTPIRTDAEGGGGASIETNVIEEEVNKLKTTITTTTTAVPTSTTTISSENGATIEEKDLEKGAKNKDRNLPNGLEDNETGVDREEGDENEEIIDNEDITKPKIGIITTTTLPHTESNMDATIIEANTTGVSTTTTEAPLIKLFGNSTTTTTFSPPLTTIVSEIETTTEIPLVPTTIIAPTDNETLPPIVVVNPLDTAATTTTTARLPPIIIDTTTTMLPPMIPTTSTASEMTTTNANNPRIMPDDTSINFDPDTTNLSGLGFGYNPTKSQDGTKTDVNVIIAITVSIVGVVALILLVAFIYLMRKRQKQNVGQRCHPVSVEDYSLHDVSPAGSFIRKTAGRSSKGPGVLNIGFVDPSLRHNLLTASELASFVENRLKIHEEFKHIPQITARPQEVPEGCEDKNRYANVVPLPETRVILRQQNNDEKTEYINANYVRGPYDGPNYYIACQAPLDLTVVDFWRMIWEQKSRVIIQATDLVENGKNRCAEYIPPSVTLDNHATHGDIQVTLKNREVKDKYCISTIVLKHAVTDESRELTHYWYRWPEDGVPTAEEAPIIAMLLEARSSLKSYAIEESNELKEKSSTLTLRLDETNIENLSVSVEKKKDITDSNGEINGNLSNEKLKAAAKNQGPLTVHCSPGTGRTGTIIACDIAIRSLEAPSRSVDIPQIVYYARRGRANAVQTKEQYEFIYKVANMYATKITNFSNEN